ncbi:hypothetical protein SKP52_06000 [Sphingopyxis fribergensis]|uniref:Uncharacterized protein n=1 Tax=Sphingopyxis fribergensis TaxID=1515612 RepID=A0A0A7PDP2_9SPHN|nr:tetratricopeptide repeat protein [Sphingopyxis fribergensis]AJA08125.1 hypothetical protein SKP52_06000 [Sphingopyxis fribergensis]
MTGDDDLHSLLPDPPPPAPKRREAAIADALARFDGTSVAEHRPRRDGTAWWKSLRGPQAGLFATAALVAAISLPFAWTTLNPAAPAADEQVPPSSREKERIVARDIVDAPAAVSIATPPSAEADRVEPNIAAPPAAPAAPPAKRVELAQAETAAPTAVAAKAEEAAPIVVQGRAYAPPLQDTPSAVSAISADRASENDVVVTGTRISKPPRRGDWNACTVNDPSRTLSKCKRLANKGAKDVREQADAHLSEGLKHAWKGDLDEAIVAFDQAIAVAPDLSVAYLNRGLAYDRQGESTRAIADLDRAIRHAPQSARAYYNRSLLLRKQGEVRRADVDERRAVSLDNRYQAAPRPD